MSKKNLEHLTDIQFHVTQENGTERPFDNIYWDYFAEGIYVDIVDGEVLFSSQHKFKSSCGWPSFYKALNFDNIVKKIDLTHGIKRIEVRSKSADSHLGHLFNDGPAPTGIRYCINSAAINFIPKHKMSELGYEKYLKHFDEIKINKDQLAYATFGAGCFWGVEAIFRGVTGVDKVTSGYSGGEMVNPSYEDICKGNTGHAEVIQIAYDQSMTSFTDLLDVFFRMHDPTTLNRQGYDVGSQYRSVIFYHNDKQKNEASYFIQKLSEEKKFSNPIVTEISEFKTFYPAEEYHQDYYSKKYGESAGPICHFLKDV